MGNLKARNLQGKVVTEEQEREKERREEEEEEEEEGSGGEGDEDGSDGDEDDDEQHGAKRRHQAYEQDSDSPPNAIRRLGLVDEAVEDGDDLVSQDSDPLEDEEDYMIEEMGGFVTKDGDEDSFGHLSDGGNSDRDGIDDHESRRQLHSKANKKKRRLDDGEDEDKD
jgi:hypothetical protein